MKKFVIAAACVAVMLCSACSSAVESTAVSTEEQRSSAAQSVQSSVVSSLPASSSSAASSMRSSQAASSSHEDIPLVADEWSPPDDVMASNAASMEAENAKLPKRLDLFDVKVIDKNGLPVNNAVLTSPVQIERNYTPVDWRTDMNGVVCINHRMIEPYLFDYDGTYEMTATVEMPKSIGNISQTFPLITTKEAVEAGIVFQMEHYDSTTKLDESIPSLVVTGLSIDGQPLANHLVEVRPASIPIEPNGMYVGIPRRFTDKDGKAVFYNLPNDEYVLALTNKGAVAGVAEITIVYDSTVVNKVTMQAEYPLPF